MIQAFLLAALGVTLGLLTSTIVKPHTPQGNFNNVRCGVFGALVGGLLLPRAIFGIDVSRSVDVVSLLMGAAFALPLLALLAGWRRRAQRR